MKCVVTWRDCLEERQAGSPKTGGIPNNLRVLEAALSRNATNQTFRIETREIVNRSRSPVSLMPNGLLKDLRPEDYADLYAYLRTLGAPPVTAEQTKK